MVENITKPPTVKNIKFLRSCRVPYGLACSPYLLAATIQHHLSVCQQYKEISMLIKDCWYVDNLLVSMCDVEFAKSFVAKSKQLMALAGMDLRDMISNSSDVVAVITQSDLPKKLNSVEKVLGLRWFLSSLA